MGLKTHKRYISCLVIFVNPIVTTPVLYTSQVHDNCWINEERSHMPCIYTTVVLHDIVRVLWFCKYEKDCLTYHHVVYESTDMYIILFWAYGSIALNFMGIRNQERHK